MLCCYWGRSNGVNMSVVTASDVPHFWAAGIGLVYKEWYALD